MKWVIGNWKMNLGLGESEVLAQATAHLAEELPGISVGIAPPTPFLYPIHDKLKFRPTNFFIASQTLSSFAKGAYTGDVAAFQLKGVVSHVIIGHSERRKWHHDSELIANQIRQALACDIKPIVCFGEAKRDASVSSILFADLRADLGDLTPDEISRCVFAYEPVWAISTNAGAVPATPAYIIKVVSRVQEFFASTYNHTPPILYGGSVNEDNVEEIAAIKQISGALVGGASLQIKSFSTICRAFTH